MQNGSVYNVGSSASPIQYYPDSNIKSLADSVNGSWTYGYDHFNRLVSAAQGGGPTYTFDYDRFKAGWPRYSRVFFCPARQARVPHPSSEAAFAL